MPEPLQDWINADVDRALAEDIGAGDLSAAAVTPGAHARAQVIARTAGVLCGAAWFEHSFARVDSTLTCTWHLNDGERITANRILCEVEGPARSLLTAERTALNFLQLLSGVASATRLHVDAVAGTGCVILDTRKTLPGLRRAQKYAVTCGGGRNHRMGLYDGGMLKENHLLAAGGIARAIELFRASHPDAPLTVEIESLDQVRQALAAGADHLLLDNFTPTTLRTAVDENAGRAHLEASGGITLDTIRAVAETGVDSISIGSLTRDIHSLDLSLRCL